MISPFPLRNLIKILIPTRNCSPFLLRASLALLLILAPFLCLSCSCSPSFTAQSVDNEDPTANAMKIHPLPKKRNITIQYAARDRAQEPITGGSHKKLRRLPHIFSRVLELPFRSDADVSIEESPDCFKFVAETDGIGDVRAHTVEIHPGVTKIVIRANGSLEISSLDELELDMWRFRLPESTRPELASAVYEDGELIVTVPKGADMMNLEEDAGGAGTGPGGGGGNGGFRGGMGNSRLVLVQ